MVETHRAANFDGTNNEVRADISREVDPSPSLRYNKDLFEVFVDSVSNVVRSAMSGDV